MDNVAPDAILSERVTLILSPLATVTLLSCGHCPGWHNVTMRRSARVPNLRLKQEPAHQKTVLNNTPVDTFICFICFCEEEKLRKKKIICILKSKAQFQGFAIAVLLPPPRLKQTHLC